MKRIDRIDQKGNIREHVVSDDASYTLCGLHLRATQEPAGNAKCKRCVRLLRTPHPLPQEKGK